MFGRNQGPANPVAVTKDPTGAPAVDLNQLAGHQALKDAGNAVGVELRKRGLAGMRGRVIVVLDHSGSMKPDYNSGAVQKLLTRTLGFGCQVDTDGTVEVIPFDSRVWPTVRVDVGTYQQAVRAELYRPHDMGLTNLADALNVVRREAEKTREPIVCIVLTDGDPYDGRDAARSKQAATRAVCDLARYPVFLKFLALRNVPYLQQLDDLEDTNPGARLLDNVDTKTIRDPGGISDADFAEAMADEWDSWLRDATAAGVVTR